MINSYRHAELPDLFFILVDKTLCFILQSDVCAVVQMTFEMDFQRLKKARLKRLCFFYSYMLGWMDYYTHDF